MCDYITIQSLQPTDTECDSPSVLHSYRLQESFPVPYDLIESEMHCSNARSLTSRRDRDGDAAGGSCGQNRAPVAPRGPEIPTLEVSDNTQ